MPSVFSAARLFSRTPKAPTPKVEPCPLREALDAWVVCAQPGENRAMAAERILHCARTKTASLNLGDLGLTTLPDCIGELRDLACLTAHHNHLTHLPESIGRLANLEKLNLARNRLTTLPASFGNLVKLEYLTLNDNRLPGVPAQFGLLANLKVLRLMRNQLAYLSRDLRFLTHLETLRLDNNRLVALPDYIDRFKKLNKFSFSDNPLKCIPPALLDIGDNVELCSIHIWAIYDATYKSLEADVNHDARRTISELTRWADMKTADDIGRKHLSIDANWLLSCLLCIVEQHRPLPADSTAKGALFRSLLALEKGVQFPLPPDQLAPIARTLLWAAGNDRQYFVIDGVLTPRKDIEALSVADNGARQAENEALENAYDAIQGGWAANVHLEGFILRGARLLDELKARIAARGHAVELLQQPTRITFLQLVAELTRAHRVPLETRLLMRDGARHMFEQNALPVDEGGLQTTVWEALNVMMTYVTTHPDPEMRRNLEIALLQRVVDIGREKPCNTGCVQRILQTPEGVDLSLVSGEPDEAALRNEMLSVAGEVNNVLEEEYLFDYYGDEPDEAEINKLKQDMIRAAIEARFVSFRGLKEETVARVSEPVLKMVEAL